MVGDKTAIYSYQFKNKTTPVIKFIFGSLIGIFVYFVPFSFMGSKSIFLDHLVSGIIHNIPVLAGGITLLLILAGSILPFYERSWNRDYFTCSMSFLKILGACLGVAAFFQIGPVWLINEDMLRLLFYSIAMPVALIVPIGSFFLTFITGYGLLGFLGVLLKPVMQPIWKVPGIGAVNVVASFVGSFSVGIFMADQFYRQGKYTKKEAAVILTGFSTVSVSFMVIIAKNLELMELWNTFFWLTLFVTFFTTAVTVRLYPLKNYPSTKTDTDTDTDIEEKQPGNILSTAWKQAISEAEEINNPLREILRNLKDGILMSMRFLPLILAVGSLVFFLSSMTPFFNWVAYGFYPIIHLLQIPEPMTVARAISTVGAEVLMPSLFVSEMNALLPVRLITGVVSVSAVLFFSGTIPCILSTSVDISLKDLLIILLQRIILSLLILSLILRFIL